MGFYALLVDDEAGIVQVLSRVLASVGIRILTATNLDEALDLLGRYPVKVMITDFRMPGCDGLELCRQARQRSPCTYRLLLSGHVEYPLLRTALQRGEVHRFIAKPWNNASLIRDVEEGARQSDLMFKIHSLKATVQDDQAAFLTDRNWVIRLASQRLCTLLGIPESDLVGRNLFAASICSVSVTQEAEITRQTEADQTWLGQFSLLNSQRREIPVWLAISSLSRDFRICACNFAVEETDQPDGLRRELMRYSGAHQLDEFSQYLKHTYGQPRVLMVEFPAEMVNDADLSAICYERISAASGQSTRVFTPAPHLFMLPVSHHDGSSGAEALTVAIRQTFASPLIHRGQIMQVTPSFFVDDISSQNDEPFARLRHQLKEGQTVEHRAVITPQPQVEEPPELPVLEVDDDGETVIPVFDDQGRLVALQSPQLADRAIADWILDARHRWQRYFDGPAILLIHPQTADPVDPSAYLATLELPHPEGEQRFLMLNGATVHEQTARTLKTQLERLHLLLMLCNPEPAVLTSRAFSSLPVAGLHFSAERLQLFQGQEISARRALARMKTLGIKLYVSDLDDLLQLAGARQWQMDWLGGDALSRPVNSSQLQWFASIEG